MKIYIVVAHLIIAAHGKTLPLDAVAGPPVAYASRLACEAHVALANLTSKLKGQCRAYELTTPPQRRAQAEENHDG